MQVGVLGRASPHRRKSYFGYFLTFAFWLIGSQAAFAAVNVNPSTLPTGTQGVLYDQSLTGSGGNGPYTFAVTGGALPPGITLDGTSGQLTGTPSAQGVYSFTVTATDVSSATGSRDVSWLSQMVRATGHWNFEAN